MVRSLRLFEICKSYGPVKALSCVSLEVPQGRFTCLLGPSGCGKTTLLRTIAGLEKPDSGRIFLGSREITGLSPSARGFGVVFQSYALFPNLTARENIAYGLDSRGLNPRKIQLRVLEMLDLVGLKGEADRYPSQLSGGQQQRVALARALVPAPDLLLLDEPLSALDAKVRMNLRRELRNLQERLGITTVMVTHDQEEALSIADEVVVMKDGQIMQKGSPLEIYDRPANPFVADFVGAINFLEEEGRVTAIRPEHVRVFPEGKPGFQAEVREIEFRGASCRLVLGSGKTRLVADVPASLLKEKGIGHGCPVRIDLPPEHCISFDSVPVGA